MRIGWWLGRALVVSAALGGPGAAWAADATPPGAAGARALPASLAAKLDTRLVDEALSDDPSPVAVWLDFSDKGERDAADLLARLAAAEEGLTERARARRLRARVSPIVGYDDLPVYPGYLRELERRGLTVAARSRWLNRAAVRVPGARLAELAELPFVARIAPVEQARRSADLPGGDLPPSPPGPAMPAPARLALPAAIDYGQSLAMLQQMNVPAVHDSGYIGSGALACILDDGFNYHETHEALRNILFAPGMKRDFVQGDTVVSDTTSLIGLRHGTQTMGCIAANLPGRYVGSGFGASFALARTEVDASETPVEMLYWGMGAEWADSLGADLITSSLGYFTFDNAADNYTYADMNGRTTDVSRAAEIAASKGILVLNAVGNEGNTSWHYLIAPSDVVSDSLIAVGAVDQNGVVASFSSYGPNAAGCIKPDLAARGVSNTLVCGCNNANAYAIGSGTSFSTPLLAGLAACLLQARPSWPPTLIARALRETASRAGSPDNRVGWGIPDGLAVLRWDPGVAGVPDPMPRFGLRVVGPNPLRIGGPPLRVDFGLGVTQGPGTAARVRVFDAQGRLIRDLYDGAPACQATVSVSWDGRRRDGSTACPGLYFIALESGGTRRGARAILLP